MDKTLPMENPEPEEGGGEDFATRRIDPDELFAAAGQEVPPESDAATEMITQAEDPAATKVISGIPESAPPSPQATEPPPPVIPAQPAAALPPAPPKKDNRTPTVAIIGVAVVLLACICACTIIAVTALVMVQNF